MLSVTTAYFMYKVANDMVPDTLARMFLRVHKVSERNSPQSNDFHISIPHTAPGRVSLTHRLLNRLPDDMKERL